MTRPRTRQGRRSHRVPFAGAGALWISTCPFTGRPPGREDSRVSLAALPPAPRAAGAGHARRPAVAALALVDPGRHRRAAAGRHVLPAHAVGFAGACRGAGPARHRFAVGPAVAAVPARTRGGGARAHRHRRRRQGAPRRATSRRGCTSSCAAGARSLAGGPGGRGARDDGRASRTTRRSTSMDPLGSVPPAAIEAAMERAARTGNARLQPAVRGDVGRGARARGAGEGRAAHSSSWRCTGSSA